MEISFISSIHAIQAHHWDALWSNDYPFTQHAFLALLEDSQATTRDSGWEPYHAVVRDEQTVIAVMPLFIKHHSYGEYVFDWSWADAYHHHHLNYYPKLMCAIPFTPATGPRLAISQALQASDRNAVLNTIKKGLEEQLNDRFSSWHGLFPDVQSIDLLNDMAPLVRYGYQFHWFNQGYTDFDHFLTHFSSRKRKNIKKERLKVQNSGVDIQMTLARDTKAQDWELFAELYQITYLKNSGHSGYLSPAFFTGLAQALPDNILLCQAKSDNRVVAASLFFLDQQTLYGRYWGALESFDGLHFECCYYQGIEYAIANKLKRFDPGAQGEHKIQRGFTPIMTRSVHLIKHPQFSNAITDFVREEKDHIKNYVQRCRERLPFNQEHSIIDIDTLYNG